MAVNVALALFIYLSTEGRAIHRFKKQFPGVGIVLILLGGGFVTYTFDSLLVFLLGILLPFCSELLYLIENNVIFETIMFIGCTF